MPPEAAGRKILIVTAEYYRDFADRLEEGAREALAAAGAPAEGMLTRRVPGCWELPFAAQGLIRRHLPDAVIALGVLIQGETDHYEHIARETCAGLMRVSLEESVHVALGVLTCRNREQAAARCGMGGSKQNKGREAAQAVLGMLSGHPG